MWRERGQFESKETNQKAVAIVGENDDKMQNSSVAMGPQRRMQNQRILSSRIKKTWKMDLMPVVRESVSEII